MYKMYRYIDNMPYLERRFIEALRPQSRFESDEDYFFSTRICKKFLVLKEYEDDILCVQVNLLRFNSKVKFFKKDYPELRYDSSPSSSLVFIKKDDVREVYDSFVKEDSYFNVMLDFNSSSFYTMTEEQLKRAQEALGEYYSSKIMRGSVIYINNGLKGNYYVKDVLVDGNLELLELVYDKEKGLIVSSLDSVLVPYNSILVNSYVYSEEYSNKIQKLIDEKRLSLK